MLLSELQAVTFRHDRWSYLVRSTGKQSLMRPVDMASHHVYDLYFGSELILNPGVLTSV